MTLESFIGNQRRVQQLREAILTSHLSHAYLFTGAHHIGKRTLARALASAVQCTARTANGDSCGICTACRKILHGNHPDVTVLELPKDKQSYSIEQIRTLIDGIAFRPTEGSKRIYIIPNADAMTIQAQQASLKILEEPPATGMIILTTTSDELVLPTMISRCQEISLTPVESDTIVAALQKRFGDLTAEQALELAILSGGRPGWALTMHDNQDIVEKRRTTLQSLHSLLHTGRAERMNEAATFAEDREKARESIEIWLSWWHDVLVSGYGAPNLIQFQEGRSEIIRYAQKWGAHTAHAVIKAMIKALEELDQNGNPRMVFEVMLQAVPIEKRSET